MNTLATLDWLIVGLYFVLIIGIVWWSSRKQDTSADYFLAGRNVGWFAIGASLFASNIGSEHIVGLAGSGANSGMAMAHWELHGWIIIMLGWIFVPFYRRSGIFTMPEFLEKRFSSNTRWILSIISLMAYVLTKVSVTVYAGALVFETLLPDTFGSPENAFWVGALSTVILTGIYTVLGGFRAVVYTEVAQTVLLLLGSFFITFFGLRMLGGWGELQAAVATNREAFALWRPLSDPEFPWLGIVIASPVIGIWYWCTDQYIVQRTLAAKDLKNARRATIWGGFLKVWPVMIFLIPGMIGWALYQKGLLAIPQTETGELNGDQIFPTLVSGLLPVGLRGLVVGGLLSALMSSLSSLFNSCATLFTVDIYEKMRPGRTEAQLVKVGRIATGAVVILGILWIPVMKWVNGGGLYVYLQSVQSYLAPPIASVFVLGLCWKRMNSRGAIAGLTVGIGIGLIKITVQALVGSGAITLPALVAFGNFNYLYFGGVLLVISCVVIVIATLTSEKPRPEQIAGLTFGSLTEEQKKAERESWNWVDVVTTCLVLCFVFGVYLYFSFWV
ncbi:MAG: sodium:solute symporter [Opitutales bacterium]|nr:sodium:solute symporter [Opitutales bacterium]